MTVQKKRRTNEEIKKIILDYLFKTDHPRTTQEVSVNANLDWRSADRHLRALMREKKVFLKKIGRQCQWWTHNVDEQRRRNKLLEEELKKKDKEIAELKTKIDGIRKKK